MENRPIGFRKSDPGHPLRKKYIIPDIKDESSLLTAIRSWIGLAQYHNQWLTPRQREALQKLNCLKTKMNNESLEIKEAKQLLVNMHSSKAPTSTPAHGLPQPKQNPAELPGLMDFRCLGTFAVWHLLSQHGSVALTCGQKLASKSQAAMVSHFNSDTETSISS